MIADVLDLTCSLEGCLVQSGVCAPLDDLRATVDQLPDILTQVCMIINHWYIHYIHPTQ